MLPNDTEKPLTMRQLRAVEHVAQDVLSDVEIAAELKVSKNTLERWKRDPAFAAAVSASAAALADAVRAEGIANKQNRIDSYRSDYDLTEQIRAEWAAYAETSMKDAPGAKTGFVVPVVKGLGSGENFHVITEYEFNTAMFNARNAIRDRIAKELGQITDKSEMAGELLIRRYVGVDMDAV